MEGKARELKTAVFSVSWLTERFPFSCLSCFLMKRKGQVSARCECV